MNCSKKTRLYIVHKKGSGIHRSLHKTRRLLLIGCLDNQDTALLMAGHGYQLTLQPTGKTILNWAFLPYTQYLYNVTPLHMCRQGRLTVGYITSAHTLGWKGRMSWALQTAHSRHCQHWSYSGSNACIYIVQCRYERIEVPHTHCGGLCREKGPRFPVNSLSTIIVSPANSWGDPGPPRTKH